jgi:hypothetical protein
MEKVVVKIKKTIVILRGDFCHFGENCVLLDRHCDDDGRSYPQIYLRTFRRARWWDEVLKSLMDFVRVKFSVNISPESIL